MLYSIIKTITPKFLKDSIYRVLNIKIIKYIQIDIVPMQSTKSTYLKTVSKS